MNQLTQITEAARRGDPKAQFALGLHLNNSGQGAEAITWFKQAAANGNPDAAMVMASAYAHGQFTATDPKAAVKMLKAAHKAGHPGGTSALASARLQGFGCSADWQGGIDCLIGGASRGDVQSAYQCAALLYLRGDRETATNLLYGLSARDIIASGLLLRALREDGLCVENEATLVQRCVQNNFPLAPDLKAPLEGAKPWTPRRSGPDWRKIKQALRKPPRANKADVTIKNEQPEIKVIKDAIPAFICDYILVQAAPKMQPAHIIDPDTGQARQDPYRRAKAMTFGPVSQDSVISCLDRMLMQLSGSPVENGEQMGVLSYLPGEEYKPHYDCFMNASDVPEAELHRGGQRVRTVLLVLYDDFTGGGTSFPKLDLVVNASKGSVIIFDNVDDTGEPEERSLHAGNPVQSGTKWIATKWIRAGAYRN